MLDWLHAAASIVTVGGGVWGLWRVVRRVRIVILPEHASVAPAAPLEHLPRKEGERSGAERD